MKISYAPFIRTLEEQLYLDSVVEHLKKTRTIIPPSTVQAASTRATLNRDVKDDDRHIARLVGPMPDGWKAIPNAKTLDEAVGARHIDPIEQSHFQAIRRRPKNSFGQSEKSGVSPSRREAGIQAFRYTPPAKVTQKEVESRAVNLVQYKSEPMTEEWVQIPWYKALIHWIKGNKVKQEITDTKRTWSDEILPDPCVQGDPKGMEKKT